MLFMKTVYYTNNFLVLNNEMDLGLSFFLIRPMDGEVKRKQTEGSRFGHRHERSS